jgi:3-oxoacyl-[acyl-carrier-protein] synthase III
VIGIAAIAVELPSERVSNLEILPTFGLPVSFLREKVGVLRRARMPEGSDTSDLCVAAAERLLASGAVDRDEVECLVVVTQNPDGYGLPHTSAIVHGRLGLDQDCSTFDISLGCSGYVHALAIVSAFLAANGVQFGLLVTADPYSKIIAPDDKDTALLFGDAATATLLSSRPLWRLGKFDFGTAGDLNDALRVGADRRLHMNGRTVFNFCATRVPESIKRTLDRNGVALEQIDRIVLHQGSKYIVDTIANRLGASAKTEFCATDYGNTISSSIPIMLAGALQPSDRRIIISGFGVGLAWATTFLERMERQ